MLLKRICTLGLIASFGALLHADWKITTAVESRFGRYVQTEYFKGRLDRVDSGESTSVMDFEHLRQTLWNSHLQEYAVVRLRQGVATPPVGPQIVIDRVTVDTGERKAILGRLARHLITEETRTSGDPNTSLVKSHAKIDTWYVDAEQLPAARRGHNAYLVVGGTGRPRVKVNQTGPAPSGLAVWEKQTSTQLLPNSAVATNETLLEVTELVEADLPPALFAPPAGFKRVITFTGHQPPSWMDRLRLEWERLEDWVSGLVV